MTDKNTTDTSSDDSGSDIDDIEAFLREQEGDDYVPPDEDEPYSLGPEYDDNGPEMQMQEAPARKGSAPVVDVDESDLQDTAQFKKPRDLDSPKGEVVQSKDPRTVRKEGSAVAKNVESTKSPGLRVALFLTFTLLFLVPVGGAVWILGSLLGSWIGTPWIMLLTTLIVVLVPGIVVRLLVKRGYFRLWIAGWSLVGILVAIFALPTLTGEALIRHGHWVVSSITTPLGFSPDNFVVRGMNTLDGLIASSIGKPAGGIVPSVLGSGDPLINDSDAPKEAEKEGKKEDGKEADEADQKAADDAKKESAKEKEAK